jgi:tetratricopeptide (TPR) repeat protein
VILAFAALLGLWSPLAQDAAPKVDIAARIAQALARDPSSLPTAPEGKWKDWNGTSPLADPLARALGAGIATYRDGELGLSLAQFHAILELEPDLPPALYHAGLCYFRLRRYRDCAVLITRFEAVAPLEVGATRVLGHALYSLGRYGDALAQYEKVLGVAPDDVEARRGLALSRMRLGGTEEALKELERVLERKPDHGDAQTWKAQLLFDLGRSEEALVAATRASELDPFEPKPWYLLGQIQIDLGHDDLAAEARARFEMMARAATEIRSLEALLLTEPYLVGPQRRLVEVHASIGDVKVVRDRLTRLIVQRPKDVDVRIFALDTWVAVGDEESARAAALDLERECADQAEAWKRLETYWASVRDRVRQVQASERYLRLKGGVKGDDR